MDPLWLALVEAAQRFARANLHDEPVALKLELRHLASVRLPLPLPGGREVNEGPPPAPGPAGQSPRTDMSGGGTDTEEAILAVLQQASEPMKGRTIAHRAGCNYSSHFREALAALVAAGVLTRPPAGGYWLAERPLPQSPPS